MPDDGQAAEELSLAVDPGFSPDIKPIKISEALAPEAYFSGY
jgi:hypothetical protein